MGRLIAFENGETVSMRYFTGPLTKKSIAGLRPAQEVAYSGLVYTARDQAHKRLAALIQQGRRLPVELAGKILYYCGPTPAPSGMVIGSCGPTTAGRMDIFTPLLLRQGVVAMIGKGERSRSVVEAIKEQGSVYFVTYAGCGALLQSFVTASRVVAFPDLGPEAVHELQVKNFPLIVAIDSRGNVIRGFGTERATNFDESRPRAAEQTAGEDAQGKKRRARRAGCRKNY